MSIHDIFPEQELTETEEDIIALSLDTPLMKRYLRLLSLNDMKDFMSLKAITTPEYGLTQAYAVLQGRMEVVSALLSISANKANKAQS